ncbi:MAG: hypothetical protein JKY12_01560 [Sneathiella sp.]|nr:hypothetical protein [Sneathiella sp.]
MFKKISLGLVFSAGLFVFSVSSAQAANHSCIVLGGTALANAVSETELVGALTGSFAGGARAKITAQRETATGLSMDMEHYFLNDKGGLLNTNDVAKLTAIPGKDKTYMLEINYHIQNASGRFEGYKGSFQSKGLIDLGAGTVVLRYNGEICK